MQQKIESEHFYDDRGNPAGGHTSFTGCQIEWQNGPLANPDGSRNEPSGAFVEGVIAAAIDRLRYYQGEGRYADAEPPTHTAEDGREVITLKDFVTWSPGKFRCRQNALAITHLEEALHWCQDRTAEREGRGVEGTHAI